MSAFDVAGAVIWTPLAVLFFASAIVPAKPPAPRYGSTEVGAFFLSILFGFASAFCIARLCGAHL